MEHTSTPRSSCNVDRLKYVQYEDIDERKKTYEKWPKHHVTDPSALAAAGFFYTGEEDLVRCFCCGGGLKNWENGDIPLIRHEKSFPLCSFLNLKNTKDVNSERGNSEKAEICKQIRNFSYRRNQESRSSLEEACRRATCVAPDTRDPGHLDLPQPNLIDKLSKNILPAETIAFAAASPEELEIQRSLQQLREENKRLKDKLTCKTCWQCEVCILFLPCEDLVACELCAERRQNCPVCGKIILEKIKIYR